MLWGRFQGGRKPWCEEQSWKWPQETEKEVCSGSLPRAACFEFREGRVSQHTKEQAKGSVHPETHMVPFRSLWIIMQFSFVIWFVCLFFKNPHFLGPWFSKHPCVLPFPDAKSFEGVLMPLSCLQFPIFHPKLQLSVALPMGFILELFLFFRFERTWKYFSWWECSHLKGVQSLLFWKGKINQGKKSKLFSE